MALPLLRGGWELTGDHPAHVAEIVELATHASGWSDLAFAGFPLGTLHSPLWYGALVWATRLGVPAWFGYLAALVGSEMVLGLTAFEIARRRVSISSSLLLAVVIQTETILVVGPSGVLSGMWTFGLAIAALLALFDRVHEPMSARVAAQVAACVALVGLTHSIVIYGVVAVVFARCVTLVLDPAGRRSVLAVCGSAIVGALASIGYWGTAALSIDSRDVEPVVAFGFPNLQTFFRPLLDEGLNVVGIVRTADGLLPDLALWVLVGIGLLRAGQLNRRSREELVTALFVSLGVALFVSQIASLPYAPAFGPIPWRIMVATRALLLFVALSAFAGHRPNFPHLWTIGAAVLALAWYAREGQFVRGQTVPSYAEERAQVESLVDTLSHTHVEGRVYVQNTFGMAPNRLASGHALSSLSARTGHRCVGAFYTWVPFRADRWLSHFNGSVVGLWPNAQNRLEVDQRLNALGVDVLVLSEPTSITEFRGRAPDYVVEAEVPPFVIFRRRSVGTASESSRMVSSTDPTSRIENFRYEDGVIEFDAIGSGSSRELRVAVSFNRNWVMEEGPTDSPIGNSAAGLMWFRTGAADEHVRLAYHAPRWPWLVSLLGWVVIAAAFFSNRDSKTRA